VWNALYVMKIDSLLESWWKFTRQEGKVETKIEKVKE
jgi:hypothetical protein